jgi:hypothetical protein
MPQATTDTFARLDLTTSSLPVSITIPVRSKTALAGIDTSYSINSPFAGVLVAAIANLTVIDAAFLLQILTVTTANVSSGTVYTVVFDAPARSAVPNLPVAMFYSPSLIYVVKK